MKFFLLSPFALITLCGAYAQNIQVDASTYSPQQLIEDVLINSDCIDNIQVTNVVGGNFSNDKSYGYFTRNGSNFPFEKGIVMSTGKLSNVPGPNNNLSDDDASGWVGDPDLENAIGIPTTTNATIIEFDFLPNADNIRFRYLFASEEYQEGSQNTCIYSDAFAFLIKPVGGTYTNLAVVPETNTPVLVTTVHSGIPGSCSPINEEYFGGWNGTDVPINFNGQTKILVAETPVTPNQTYHIKLVIGDEQNYRYDSAVFLEAESFSVGADLGTDRSFINNNPLCDEERYLLDATPNGSSPMGYTWFKNGILLPSETNAQLDVTSAGTYKVELDFGPGCTAIDEILIEYSAPIVLQDTDLIECEATNTGIATFNLNEAIPIVINGDTSLRSAGFFNTRLDAENNTRPIPNQDSYTNTRRNEVIFDRVVSPYNCEAIAEVTLKTAHNILQTYDLASCSFLNDEEYASFDLSKITTQVNTDFGGNLQVTYYASTEDLSSHNNPLPVSYTNTQPVSQLIYGSVSGTMGCIGIVKVNLFVIPSPQFKVAELIAYCANIAPETITIDSNVKGSDYNYTFLWSTGETTPTIDISSAGNYSIDVTQTTTINGNQYSCTSTNVITVVASEIAEISYEVSGNYGNQTLTVTATGAGSYLYALDDENGRYQESNVFRDIPGGIHTVFVTDILGCGTVSLKVYVLDFPRFFTPNNDDYHDFWQIKGLNFQELQLERVVIFDRFGKILYVINLNSSGWDGTYNGKLMPSSDYWFNALFTDGGIYRGHFTLKR